MAHTNSNTSYPYLKENAASGEDLEKIEYIEQLRSSIKKGSAPTKKIGDLASVHSDTSGEAYIDLHIDEFTFHLSEDLAPSSIDTIEEIFGEHRHRKVPEFSGEDAEVVVDIGANEGFYSLAMLQARPQLYSLAVEPVSRVHTLLEKNVETNSPLYRGTIQSVRTAVNEKEGYITLQLYPHLSTISSRNIHTLEQNWIKDELIETETVASTRLHTLFGKYGIPHVDILKIDVEGDEAALLETADLSAVDRIVLEWHSFPLRDYCIKLLTSRGFTLAYAEAHRFGDLYFTR